MRLPTRWLAFLAISAFGLGLLAAVRPGVAADKDEKVTPEQKAAREQALTSVQQIADMLGDEKKAEDIQKKSKELAEKMMKADFAAGVVDKVAKRLECLVLPAAVPELRYFLDFVDAKNKPLEAGRFDQPQQASHSFA